MCAAGWLFLGWCLHYIPFYTMGRVLYYHHYFPALLFSSMLTAVIIDYLLGELCSVLPSLVRAPLFHTVVGLVLAAAAYSFYIFSPLAYGMKGENGQGKETNSSLHSLLWIESWEF